MGVTSQWHDVRWRASILAISGLFKFHTAILLSVILFKLCMIYTSKILRLGYGIDSRFLSVCRVCVIALASYLALLVMFTARSMSFRASMSTDIYHEIVGLISMLATLLNIAIASNLIIRVYITKFQLMIIVLAVILHQMRLRRHKCDVLRALDRESIAAPLMRTFITGSIFHVVISAMVAMGTSVVTLFFSYLSTVLRHPAYISRWNYAAVLDELISLIPGIGKYTGNIYGTEWICICISTVWIIAMTEAFYDDLNRQFSHMDHIIVNNLEEFPSHGSREFEDELTLARAFLNYSRGVSVVLNMNAKKFEPSGNAMHINFPEDPRRCPMVPFSKVNQSASYNTDTHRKRYQVDAVVYRMLVDSSGKLFTSYVEAYMECLVELEGHIVALTSHKEKMGSMCIDLKPESDICDSCNSWLDFMVSFIPGMTPKVPYKTSDALVLAIIYMRGLSTWLCIANMLGYNGTHIQQVAKEFVAQCVSLSKAIGTVKRYSMPTHFSNTLDIITNVINISLKQMSVYADYMLYSAFDTDFDTFRLLEKMYKNTPQPAVG